MKRPNNQNITMLVTLGLLTLSLMTQNADAHQFKIGGSGEWSLTSASSYDQWAQKSRFQIGDTLCKFSIRAFCLKRFNYQANGDSVLQVSEGGYKTCTTTSPNAKYSDGHTMIKLNQSGPHYFISGVVDHCKKNEKVMIIVLADRSKSSSQAPSQSPSPSPSSAPPPAPTSEEYPSPPPAPGAPEPEMTPGPAPSDESHPPPPSPSGASFIVVNFFYSVGAFVGFSVLFDFLSLFYLFI